MDRLALRSAGGVVALIAGTPAPTRAAGLGVATRGDTLALVAPPSSAGDFAGAVGVFAFGTPSRRQISTAVSVTFLTGCQR